MISVIEQHLPKSQRLCLQLNLIGYPDNEIAEILGIKPTSVTRNIDRGRERLRGFRLVPENFGINPRTQRGQA